ncbi:sigma-70 family RNA polymerase sigma factor [bacterium]|nr:sigma-70 family RNA polymerase sigma factor [bacterium]MCI0616261.1 sigma-70 family RNA polymerase sigma factor [bacterium]
MQPSNEITELLEAWSGGDKKALDELIQLVYKELHRLAHRQLAKERQDHTLQTTALVNEAYLKLVDQKRVKWQGRSHFFALSSQLMRRILVDYARSRQYAKRGGGKSALPLDEALIVAPERASEMIALDEALTELANHDERKARIVELRFFSGMSIDETSELLGVSPGTVMKDWTLAKAWLQREMDRSSSE